MTSVKSLCILISDWFGSRWTTEACTSLPFKKKQIWIRDIFKMFVKEPVVLPTQQKTFIFSTQITVSFIALAFSVQPNYLNKLNSCSQLRTKNQKYHTPKNPIIIRIIVFIIIKMILWLSYVYYLYTYLLELLHSLRLIYQWQLSIDIK